jgi:hypothetical protein
LCRIRYEGKLADLERERETIEEEKAQVDRYKQLLLKQRDIMIALTQRLNERDEQIMALQDELDAYDKHQGELEEKLDEKTTLLIHLQRVTMEYDASSPHNIAQLSDGDRESISIGEPGPVFSYTTNSAAGEPHELTRLLSRQAAKTSEMSCIIEELRNELQRSQTVSQAATVKQVEALLYAELGDQHSTDEQANTVTSLMHRVISRYTLIPFAQVSRSHNIVDLDYKWLLRRMRI